MILRKQFRFEASHRLPFHKGKCQRLHGHSWVLEVEVEGSIDPSSGFVIDFAEIKTAMQPIIEELDHRHLGTWEQMEIRPSLQREWGVSWLSYHFNCTSENLLHEIARRITTLNWSSLTLHETCTSAATLTRKEYDQALHS